jgi:hypothetical protein
MVTEADTLVGHYVYTAHILPLRGLRFLAVISFPSPPSALFAALYVSNYPGTLGQTGKGKPFRDPRENLVAELVPLSRLLVLRKLGQ